MSRHVEFRSFSPLLTLFSCRSLTRLNSALAQRGSLRQPSRPLSTSTTSSSADVDDDTNFSLLDLVMQDEASQEAARRQADTVQRLRLALQKNNLVIIVGAGVTLAATADASGALDSRLTWTGLIQNGLDYLVKEDVVKALDAEVIQAYSSLKQSEPENLLAAADFLSNRMRHTPKFPTWLDSIFGSLSQKIRSSEVLETLHSLHSQGAILLTTNYDDLLEKACNLGHIGHSNQDDLLLFKRGELDGVLHVHGSYLRPSEVVLSSTDYYRITQSDEIQDILRTYLDYKTILFVGCGSGLEDPNFGALLKWAGDRQRNIPTRHCLLVRDGDKLNPSFLVRLRYGLQYQDLAPFLRKLLTSAAAPPLQAANAAPENIRTTISLLRNREFVGRRWAFDELDRRLLPSSPSPRKAALCGLGGIGKTQIALEYAYTFAARFACLTFWIHASSTDQFEESYQRIARTFEILGYMDPKADQLQLVRDWLQSRRDLPWLMIIDNIDNASIIFDKRTNGKCLLEYVPQCEQGSVLFTSRNKELGIDLVGDAIDVSVMEVDEARALLHSKSKENASPEEELEFLRELDFLPLAITQATAYMMKRRLSISQYLSLFRQNESNQTKLISHEFVDHGRESRPMESLAKTWTISFRFIKEQNPRASDILTLMSFLDRNGIPNSLLANEEEDTLDFLDAMAVLEAFSLIERKSDSEVHSMHRLVQLATRVWAKEGGDADRWGLLALSILSQRFPDGEYEHWKTCATYLPHAEAALRYEFCDQTSEVKSAKALLLMNMSNYLGKQGHGTRSVEMAQMSVALRQSMFGPEHRETLKSMDGLASAFDNQGEFRSAEEVAGMTLRGRISLLGFEHEETLDSLETLAKVQFHLGEYAAAETTIQQVVTSRTKLFGVENRHTLHAMSFHGWVLRYQGNYDSAKSQISAALEVQKECLGENHPDTLESLDMSGILEMDLGNMEAAEEIQREVVRLSEAVLGNEHVYTYAFMNNLAVTLSARHKYQEAEALNRKILRMTEIVRGEKHPDTLMSLDNLGLNLKDQGKYEEAEVLLSRALEGRQAVCGKTHVDTLSTAHELALVYLHQQKLELAEKLFREALEGRQQTLGLDHRRTLGTQGALAEALRRQGKLEESLNLYQSTLERQETTLGAAHPNYLWSRNGLALVLNALKRDDEAEALQRQTLATAREVLGPMHHRTLVYSNNLAAFLDDQCKYSEAEVMYRQTLAGREQLLGEKHVDTLSSQDSLGKSLYRQEKFEEAEAVLRQTLALRKEVSGDKDPSTLNTANLLSHVLYDRVVEYDELERLCKYILTARQEILGEDHADTLVSRENLATVLREQQKFEWAQALFLEA